MPPLRRRPKTLQPDVGQRRDPRIQPVGGEIEHLAHRGIEIRRGEFQELREGVPERGEGGQSRVCFAASSNVPTGPLPGSSRESRSQAVGRIPVEKPIISASMPSAGCAAPAAVSRSSAVSRYCRRAACRSSRRRSAWNRNRGSTDPASRDRRDRRCRMEPPRHRAARVRPGHR